MDDAETPAPVYKPSNDDEEEETIDEKREYSLVNYDKTYTLSIIKTFYSLILKILNYDTKLSLDDFKKKTKIYVENIDEAFKSVIKFLENGKMIIKNIEFTRKIILQISISDFTGKEKNIELDLLYNSKNKDNLINDLQFQYSSLEEEVNTLKKEMKEMKAQIDEFLKFKNQISKSQKAIQNIPDKIIENPTNMNKRNSIRNSISEEKRQNLETNELKPINLNFLLNLAQDSYSDWGLDNVFTAFTTIDKTPLLVYATEDKSLVFFSLYQMKVVNTIKKAHNDYITNIHHLYDEQEKKDIIMSVSAEDNHIKLWNVSNFKLYSKFKNINKEGFLLSACFLKYNDKNCIATSNGDLSHIEFGPIKIFDLKGRKLLDIKDSNYNTNYITTFYDNESSNNYLITGNDGFIKSYDVKQISSVITFVDQTIYENESSAINKGNSYRSAVVIDSEDIKMLIGSHDDGEIRIWNFYTVNLIKKIKTGNPLRGICIWNENFIFIGSKDKTIKIVDVKSGKIINSIKAHKINTVLSLKIIKIDKSGYCLISQGMRNEEINLWEIQYEKIEKKI